MSEDFRSMAMNLRMKAQANCQTCEQYNGLKTQPDRACPRDCPTIKVLAHADAMEQKGGG